VLERLYALLLAAWNSATPTKRDGGECARPRRRDRALTQVNVAMTEACDQLKMDQISTNSLPRAHGQEAPKCLSCGQPMHLVRTTPGFGGLPERTYNCQICGAVVTQDDSALVRTDRLAHLFRPSGV